MEKIKADDLIKLDLRGKVVVFPTDTVYGIGALFDDSEGIEKIYEIKQRPKDKPLAILIPNKDICDLVDSPSLDALTYVNDWPGALTVIFKKSKSIPDIVTSGLDSVALRMPDSQVALKILNHFGPMAVTSINISGEKELNDIDLIEKEFGEKIDYYVIDKEKFSSKPSKIIDATKDTIKVIRS